LINFLPPTMIENPFVFGLVYTAPISLVLFIVRNLFAFIRHSSLKLNFSDILLILAGTYLAYLCALLFLFLALRNISF
jgi:hypothetical protein